MDLTNESIIEGISGLLTSFNLDNFVDSIREYSEDNKAIFAKAFSKEAKASDISKVRKLINNVVASNLSGIVSASDLDEEWITEVLEVGTIQALGKVPVKDLKYLESDVIEVFTNGCTNSAFKNFNVQYSLLKPNVSLSRVLLAYMFIRYFDDDISARLSLKYDRSHCSRMMRDVEVRKANTAVAQLNDKSKVRDKMLSYLNELDAIVKNQKATDSLISKLATSAEKAGLLDIRNSIYRFGSCKGNICYIADKVSKAGVIEYHHLIIPIIVSNYENRYVYPDRFMYPDNTEENPIEDWNLFYNVLLVPALLVRNTQIGYLGLSVVQNVGYDYFTVQRKIASVKSISTYGSLDNSYKAFEDEVAQNYNRILRRMGYQSFVNTTQFNQLIKLLYQAEVM